jgi:autotransporter-associated beta strand protein
VTGGLGGLGGGGDGGTGSTVAINGQNGTNGLGGGGGGGNAAQGTGVGIGGAGGSGIVIIRYEGASAGTGGTVIAGTGTAAGYTLHTFTDTGTSNFDLSALDLNTRLGLTLSTAITGTGDFTFDGPGSLTLSAANTFSGATSVSAGTLTLSNASAIQNSALDTGSSIAGTASAGLKTTVTALTLGGLTGNKNLASVFTTTSGGYSGVTALTLNPGSDATPSYSGIIADGASNMTLTKTGLGTQTLTAANTYSGATNVSAGTLALSDTGTIANSTNIIVGDAGSSGAVLDLTAKPNFTIGATQTLSGIGTVNIGAGKTLTIEGTHAPGNSVGTQNVTGNQSYASGSIFAWDLEATTTDPGVVTNSGSYDQVVVSGDLTGSGAVFQIILGTNTFSDAFWNTDKTWTNIFTASNSFDLATIFTTFSGIDVGFSGIVTAGRGGSFALSGNTLSWSAVPEPTSALVGILLGAGLLRRRRHG